MTAAPVAHAVFPRSTRPRSPHPRPTAPRWVGALAAAAMLALPAILVHLTPGAAEALEWRREAPPGAGWWRPLTCHWVHWSLDHLAWDALTGAALAAGCWVLAGARRTTCSIVLTALASPWLMRLFTPEVARYRGLSDIDSALFALMVATIIRLPRSPGDRWLRFTGVAMLVGILAKTAYEVVTGATLFVHSAAAGFTPLPLVHAAGIVVGLAVGLWPLRPSVPPRGAVI